MTRPTEPEDLMRYDLLALEALRGVVRQALLKVQKDGLPGDHHFYIAFDTNADGVDISSRLHEKYPQEMTIVIQHQFWDLDITDHGFSIGLSFNNIPEKLVIPFRAVNSFFDPCVQFGLQFQKQAVEQEDDSIQPAEAKADEAASADVAAPVPDSPDGGDVVSLDAFRKKP
jgi:hypothetical protein